MTRPKRPPGNAEGPASHTGPSTNNVPALPSVSRNPDDVKHDAKLERERADDKALIEAADTALETGRQVVFRGYVLIPDTLAVELMANHPDRDWPLTYGLARFDGRMVHVFKAPAEWLR